MQELIVQGSTVDEAIDNGCNQLGVSREDVTVEVMEMPQKKLFGTSPAKVLLRTLVETKQPKPEQPATEQHPAPETQRNETHARQSDEEPFEDYGEADPTETEIAEQDLPAPGAAALAYLREIAQHMGAQRLTYRFYRTERGVKFAIDGEDSALIIGRRGETMESLQYLCMLVSSRTEGDYCKVIIDAANYRSKREKTLQALAEREAAKVKKTSYRQVLEPMNPYERRIVHSAIQKIGGVKSESVGNEPNRRVVISLISGGKTGRPRKSGGHGGQNSQGGQGRRDRDRGPRPDRGRRDSRPPRQDLPQREPTGGTAPQTSHEKTQVESGKLYGKIDF